MESARLVRLTGSQTMQAGFDEVMDNLRALSRQTGPAAGIDLTAVALRVVTDLFCVRTDYAPEDVARFEGIVHGLIPRENREALAQAAARIARHPQAPLSLLNRFVSLGGACAQAVLESAVVDDHVLIEMAAGGAPELAASVARRKDLDAATCDLLASRQEREIDLALILNRDAPCSPAVVARLADSAVADRELALHVLERWGPEAFPQLFLHAAPAQRAEILLSVRRQALATRLAPGDTASPEQRAAITAAGLSGDGERLARELAEASGMDLSEAVRIVADPDGDPLAVALTALGFLPEEAVPVLLFANPAFGTSVETVRRLAGICRTLPQAVASGLVAAMTGRHGAASRRSASVQMPRARTSVSRPLRPLAKPAKDATKDAATDAAHPKVA